MYLLCYFFDFDNCNYNSILFPNVKIPLSGSGKCALYSRKLVLVSAGREGGLGL